MLKRIFSEPNFTVDQYGPLAWVNVYEEPLPEGLVYDIEQMGIEWIVGIKKGKGTLPGKIERWLGDPPTAFNVEEFGAVYEIHTTSAHPGLFLDHQLTRKWLIENSKDKSVLNLFSYTGSLTMAAAKGGAQRSVSIDLSGPASQWATTNAQLNHLGPEHQFAKADVFDWTVRFQKKNLTFDIVISDPPSHSRSDELHFSTQKHLDLLHERCLGCLAPGGTLITSINTETINEGVLRASIQNMAKSLGRTIRKIDQLELPKGFENDFRSMKGLRILFSN